MSEKTLICMFEEAGKRFVQENNIPRDNKPYTTKNRLYNTDLC